MKVTDRSRSSHWRASRLPLAAQAPEPVRAGSDAAATHHRPATWRAGSASWRDDSMMGRDTPSRGLELTAKYVADQFRRFGLEPGGDNGTWFQRYPITRRRLQPAQLARRVSRSGGTSRRPPGFDRDGALRQRRHSRTAGRQAPRFWWAAAVTPDAVGRDEAAGQGRALRPRLLDDDPGRMPPRSPARIRLSGARRPSSRSRIWIRRRSPRGCRSTAPERYGIELRLDSPPSVEVSESVVDAGARGRPGSTLADGAERHASRSRATCPASPRRSS